MRGSHAILALTLVAGCGANDPGTEQHPVDPNLSVEIGVPAGPDGLSFGPLEAGSELRLASFGQGGTHVLLGIRSVGFGSRAYVQLSLTNLASGLIVTSPASVRPQLFACSDDEVCDLVPILAMASGLTGPDEERNGLVVDVGADVSNDLGLQATATKQVVLSTADL